MAESAGEIPLPQWDGVPPASAREFVLPTNHDIPIADANLRNAIAPPFDEEWADGVGNDGLFQRYYEQAHSPVIDLPLLSISDEEAQAWTKLSLLNCHNGLRKLRDLASRDLEFLEADELYSLSTRLLAWTQRNPNARMGNYFNDRDGPNARPRRFWISAGNYQAIRIPGNLRGPNQARARTAQPFGLGQADLPHNFVVPYDDGAAPTSAFHQAVFSLHIVHIPSHFALLVLHKPRPAPNTPAANQEPWTYWYLDSSAAPENQLARRRNAAGLWLQDWLVNRSGIAIPGPTGNLVAGAAVKMSVQIDGASCGLHVIANILALVRFETLGWDRIPGPWSTGSNEEKNRAMCSSLIKCLHNLMGLEIGENTPEEYYYGIVENVGENPEGTPEKAPKRIKTRVTPESRSSFIKTRDSSLANEDGQEDRKPRPVDNDACRCARPGRTQAVETIQVQETQVADLAAVGVSLDVPRIRVDPGPLANKNWQANRTRTIAQTRAGTLPGTTTMSDVAARAPPHDTYDPRTDTNLRFDQRRARDPAADDLSPATENPTVDQEALPTADAPESSLRTRGQKRRRNYDTKIEDMVDDGDDAPTPPRKKKAPPPLPKTKKKAAEGTKAGKTGTKPPPPPPPPPPSPGNSKKTRSGRRY